MNKTHIDIHLYCVACFHENIIKWKVGIDFNDILFQCEKCKKYTLFNKIDFVDCLPPGENGEIKMIGAFGRIVDESELEVD